MISTETPKPNDVARIIPLQHNWASSYRISVEYKTDIMTSGNGKEQRRAVRSEPRYYLEANCNMPPDTKRKLDYLMAAWGGKLMAAPVESMVVKTNQLMAPEQKGVQIVPRDEKPFWFDYLQDVVLSHEDMHESRRYMLGGATSISFTDESLTEFPRGTRIRPLVYGWLDTNMSGNRITNTVGTAAYRFLVKPGSPFPAPDIGVPEYVGGLEIFMKKPNWASNVSVEYNWERSLVDYGYGTVEQYSPHDFHSRVTKADFTGRTPKEAYEVMHFYRRHLGMCREFLRPTWEDDIPFAALAGGGLAILIDGTAFGEAYKGSTVFRRIMVRYRDGTFGHHVVDFVETLPDTNASVLWVTEPLPVAELTEANVIGISWVLVSRFAMDRLDVDFLTTNAAQFSMTMQSLENFEI